VNRQLLQRFHYFVLILGLASAAFAKPAHARPTHPTHRAHVTRVQESAHARRHMAQLRHTHPVAVERTAVTVRTRSGHLRRAVLVRHRYYEHFSASSFTDSDITQGDVTTGEDPVVRQAAIDALGNMYGTVVAIDPSNGRILAMVNQKLALSSGAEPCSTIKVSVALAALEEGIVTKDTPVNLGGRVRVNLTEALAKSNNLYFETVGRRLGFERVRHYANSFGLLAGTFPVSSWASTPSRYCPRARVEWAACVPSDRVSR
jgi:penicillin-binding protein 2